MKSSLTMFLALWFGCAPWQLGLAPSNAVSAAVPPDATAAKPESFSGCVAKLGRPADSYVLATGKSCLLLRGTFDPDRLIGHQVVLLGLETQATSTMPLILRVQSTTAVKDACTATCTPIPPGTRGVHGSDQPGGEGGTPGVQPTGKPDQPH